MVKSTLPARKDLRHPVTHAFLPRLSEPTSDRMPFSIDRATAYQYGLIESPIDQHSLLQRPATPFQGPCLGFPS